MVAGPAGVRPALHLNPNEGTTLQRRTGSKEQGDIDKTTFRLCAFVPLPLYHLRGRRQPTALVYHDGKLRQKSLSSFCQSRPNFLS